MDLKSASTLEFNKILDRLADLTHFSAGRELATQLSPTDEYREAEMWQQQTAEALNLLFSGSEVTIGPARDVRPAVDRSHRGFTLLPEDILDVKNTITAGRTLRRKLEKVRERYVELWKIGELIEECPGIVSAINQAIDDRGEVLDTASTKLANIRRDLRIVHGRIQERLRGLLTSHAAYLQDPLISMRNGRYVLPVKAESRGNIKGIVHDQSGTGATLWIEPISTVDYNNEYRQHQLEEEKEIQRILAELTARISQQGDSISRMVERLAEFDLIFAKARYANLINAIEPEFIPWRKMGANALHPGSTIWIKGARHPLLDPETVVPIDLTVPEDVFLILITGPNTGGKTVSLKTLGLMVLMAQSGLHIPCKEARISIFDAVWSDIGDEQSIEQSLSTFSAHMTNIIRVLENVDEHSLVLFDELGSGTDPAEGAALAQAVINYLRDKGATVFTATHYPELKAYATQTEGATNASLLFDLDTLSPTYEMTIGIPGKSNALAIARRLGLDETVLDDAMAMLGMGNNETEQLLDSIYDMRDKIASEEAAARLARRRAERDREKLQDKLKEIEIDRSKVLQEARKQVEDELESIRKEIQRVRKQLTNAESKNSIKRLSRQLKEIEARPLSAVTETPLIDSVLTKSPDRKKKNRPLRVGDEVFIKTINTKGEVIALHKNEVEIAVGRLHMRAAIDEVEFRNRPQQKEEPVSLPTFQSPGMELDIRGQRIDAGLEMLDKYLDQAVLSKLPWVRIIHGKGTGRLRTAVRKELTKHPAVLTWEEGEAGEGGAGVTIARFEKKKAAVQEPQSG